MKPFKCNKFYKFKDLCAALDASLEEVKRQHEGIKEFFKKSKRTMYAGVTLNSLVWRVDLDGTAKPLLREGKDTARYYEENLARAEQMIEEVNRKERYPYPEIKLKK